MPRKVRKKRAYVPRPRCCGRFCFWRGEANPFGCWVCTQCEGEFSTSTHGYIAMPPKYVMEAFKVWWESRVLNPDPEQVELMGYFR